MKTLPFSDETLVALAACAYETQRPLSEWVEWACWVRYQRKFARAFLSDGAP